MDNNPFTDGDNPFPDSDNETVITMDDMMSEYEQVVSELVFSIDPASVQDIAAETGVDTDVVSGVASTLVHAGYVVTDSSTPQMDTSARFTTDPVMSKASTRARTFRAADSKTELEDAIQQHEELISGVKKQTGMESAEAFNDAVFDADSSVAESEENQELALQWILAEQQLSILRTVHSKYEDYQGEYTALEETDGFRCASVNPPQLNKEEYLTPPTPPF